MESIAIVCYVRALPASIVIRDVDSGSQRPGKKRELEGIYLRFNTVDSYEQCIFHLAPRRERSAFY